MGFSWQLINDSITDGDRKAMTDFINTPNQKFTNGEKCKEFEMEWSKYIGCAHSTYVNSGASANYIMASIMKEQKGVGEVIVSPLGWVSDVSPLVNLGFTPVFVDVSMDNDLFLIEDCCEAHGATHKGDKVGIFGDVSNFSFYFGHHITTIEGGMVCTNDYRFWDYAKLFRSHGMTREASSEVQEQYERSRPDLNPLFTFAVPGYNFRNQEINAVLGLEQIKRLDFNCKKRSENFNYWLDNLDEKKFFVNYEQNGNSNFALPLILKEKDLELFKKCCILLDEEKVEYRVGTAGGGNQARQPYLDKYDFVAHDLSNVDHIHDFGLYIGNHPELSLYEIGSLTHKLNGV